MISSHRKRRKKELYIKRLLQFSAGITVLTTLGIIFIFVYEAIYFFKEVSIVQFFTESEWTPLFENKKYGIMALLSGTILTTTIAVGFAVPIGLSIAIYLSEYANKRYRNIVKPSLELLAAVPSVVYGFFALLIVTPILQSFIPSLSGFNALSAGLVMGFMIVPFVTSLSEDALSSVPNNLREASYGMGATRFQTVFRITLPAANSGIIVAIILAISRAVGETMIVAIAAGQQPRLTFDPTVPIETITSYIVQVSLGDVAQNSLEYRTIFAAGVTLFIFTFILNNISFYLRAKFRKQYAQ